MITLDSTKPIYILFDTNVILRSLISEKENNAPKKFLRYIAYGFLIPIYNNDIIKEYERVMSLEKYDLDHNKVISIIAMIKTYGYFVNVIPSTNYLKDETDRKMIDAIKQCPKEPKFFITRDDIDFQTVNEYFIYERKLYKLLVRTYGELEENKELDRLDEIRTNKIIDIENKSIQLMKLNSQITIEQISNEIKEDYNEVKKVVTRSKKIEQQNDIWMVK